RSTITEGQSFRANVREKSLLHLLASLHVDPVMVCLDNSMGECPNIMCTGCPLAPMLPTASAAATDAERARAWLECEECVDGELANVTETTTLVDPFIAYVRGALADAERVLLRQFLTITWHETKAYEADDRNWRTTTTQVEYVSQYEDNYRALRQVR